MNFSPSFSSSSVDISWELERTLIFFTYNSSKQAWFIQVCWKVCFVSHQLFSVDIHVQKGGRLWAVSRYTYFVLQSLGRHFRGDIILDNLVSKTWGEAPAPVPGIVLSCLQYWLTKLFKMAAPWSNVTAWRFQCKRFRGIVHSLERWLVPSVPWHVNTYMYMYMYSILDVFSNSHSCLLLCLQI